MITDPQSYVPVEIAIRTASARGGARPRRRGGRAGLLHRLGRRHRSIPA